MTDDNADDQQQTSTAVCTLEPGASWAMKLTLSALDGTSVWTALTREDWENFKSRGDLNMARTEQISAEQEGR